MYNRFKHLSTAALVVLTLIITGCTAVPERASPVPAQSALAALPEGVLRYDTISPQIAQLWSAAEQAYKDKNRDKALDHLFAALEIEPKNSMLWSRCAELQLENMEPALAESFAVKSNSFAQNDVAMLRRNWLIIEHARSKRGDLLGVRSAHKKVQEYHY